MLMLDDLAAQRMVRLYLIQARLCGMTDGDAAGGEDPLPADEGGAAARAVLRGTVDELSYARSLLSTALQATGCSAGELLAAGYALRRWAQLQSLSEQQRWWRATRCPHVTLIDGLAGPVAASGRDGAAWGGLVRALRRLALRGPDRVARINDHVIEWIEEHTGDLM